MLHRLHTHLGIVHQQFQISPNPFGVQFGLTGFQQILLNSAGGLVVSGLSLGGKCRRGMDRLIPRPFLPDRSRAAPQIQTGHGAD